MAWGDMRGRGHRTNKMRLKWGHLQQLNVSKEVPERHRDGEMPQTLSRSSACCSASLSVCAPLDGSFCKGWQKQEKPRWLSGQLFIVFLGLSNRQSKLVHRLKSDFNIMYLFPLLILAKYVASPVVVFTENTSITLPACISKIQIKTYFLLQRWV